MSLKQAIGEWFAGGREVPRGPLGALIDEAKRLAGSRAGAARALGYPESTLRSWETGRRRPRSAAAALDKVSAGIRRLMLRSDRPATVTVTISPAPRKGPATRSVPVSAAAMNRAAEQWIAGNLTGMVKAFRAGISDEWYRSRLFRPQEADEVDDDEDSQEQFDLDTSESEPAVGGIA